MTLKRFLRGVSIERVSIAVSQVDSSVIPFKKCDYYSIIVPRLGHFKLESSWLICLDPPNGRLG